MAKIKTYFDRDNFRSRRTTGCNLYDPESLLTGAEIQAGYSYGDRRDWPNQETYDAAVAGHINPAAIPHYAPRRKS